jgi:1-deoxy-D-xylulose-5-phosphate reductoisomerase
VKRVLVLGSTGSVGKQTLDVLSGITATHRVVGLSANSSVESLLAQTLEWSPEAVCLADASSADRLRSGGGAAGSLPPDCRLLKGADGLVELVESTRPDVVVCSITGAAGLRSSLAAASSGAVVALANKESLVLAGHLIKEACARSGSVLVPVDSEHSAIAQCLEGQDRAGMRRIILTASGGPFRGWDREALASVTVEQALQHPSWDMGPRITVDSATLMNKGLEIIEACHLFDVSVDRVDVVVHPQSIVHSMVEYVDGALLAQLSPPDMRLPIRYALGYPRRLVSPEGPADLDRLNGLTFESPDRETFRCLALAERAAREGGIAGTVLNAANEIAVEAFLAGRLPFLEIPDVVQDALDTFPPQLEPGLSSILETDAAVRIHATSILQPSP